MYKVFNVNSNVKVKLNEKGKKILLDIFNQYHDLYPNTFKEFSPPKVDEDGYSNYQLWYLMQTFGPYIKLTENPPFETNILIDEGDLNESV